MIYQSDVQPRVLANFLIEFSLDGQNLDNMEEKVGSLNLIIFVLSLICICLGKISKNKIPF